MYRAKFPGEVRLNELETEILRQAELDMAGLLSTMRYDLDDPTQFLPMAETVQVGDKQFRAYFSKHLRGASLGCVKGYLHFTYVILRLANADEHAHLMREVGRASRKEECDQKVIAEYANICHPGQRYMQELVNRLESTLGSAVWVGRNFHFQLLGRPAVTRDHDVAIAYIERENFQKLVRRGQPELAWLGKLFQPNSDKATK